MIRKNFIKRSFLECTPILNIPTLKFHLTPKILVRGTFRGNLRSNAEKHMKSEPISVISPNSNENFLGIESEAGVITTDSRRNITQQKVSKEKVKERFHVASFGVIRYDSDNKLKFHGQYGKTCDVFPHNNNDYSTVSANLTKVISSRRKHNDSKVNRLETSDISSKTHEDDVTCNIDVLNKKSPNHDNLMEGDQNSNSVNEYYSNNSYQMCNDLETNKLDSSTVSSDHNGSVKDVQNMNYIDKHYFNSYREEQSVENNRDRTLNDLNFIDQAYFNDQTVSENKIMYQGKNIFQNTPFVNEKGKEYVDNFYSGNIKSNNSRDEQLNSIKNNESSHKEEKNIVQDLFYSQANVSDVNVDASKVTISKEFNTTKSTNIKSYTHFDNIKTNVSMEASNLKSKRSKELSEASPDKVDYSNYDSQSVEPFINVEGLKQSKTISKETDTVNSVASAYDCVQGFQKQNNIPLSDVKSKRSKEELSQTSFGRVEYNNYDSRSVEPFINEEGFKRSKAISEETDAVKGVASAYDFVQDLRKQNNVLPSDVKKGSSFDSKGFRILKNQVNDLSNFTEDEIFDILKQSILYSDDDLMVLDKPYSLVMHESKTTKSPCLSAFLDKLAKEGNQQKGDKKLYTVHRLDKETTGCLLLARNELMAQHLKSLFAQRKIIKTYWILTSRVPDPPEGVIDIPIAEGSVNNKKRMVLNPEIPKDIAYKNHSKRGKPAVTSYKVLKESGNAALVEAIPLTGIKHQIRVHFGFGLLCPILGDHKYSHLDKLAPQKLPSDILQRLHVRQSKVRYIPLHIHAKSVTIPGYFEGKDLHVKAPLPDHMKENLKRLKFKK